MAHPPNSGKEQFSRSSNSSSSGSLEFYFLTLFPEIFEPVLSASLLGKAKQKGLVSYSPIQIRNFTTDKHRTVDDTPYGGGAGMVMRVDVLHAAHASVVQEAEARKPGARRATILLSPQGKVFDQEMAKELSAYDQLILVCGHYEGVDERFIELCVDREVSVGDYVLTGGELPALVMADVITRLREGVVGNEQSVVTDSLEGGLLKYPQYTRPPAFEGLKVPDVLLSGNHKAIQSWREREMRERTAAKRPDLLRDKS